MSDAFTAAATALAADTNLGVEATFTPAAGGAPTVLRVVPTRPEEAFGLLDGPRATAIATVVMLPAASLATRPVKGDQLAWGGLVFIVMDVAQDTRGTSWTLSLRRA